MEQGWEEITFEGKSPNQYSSCGTGCIKIETNASVSMIGKTVMPDLTRNPYLQWEWKVDGPIVESDLRQKGKDDRALAVYVTFAYDPETATFAETLARPMVELMHGEDAPGRVISYVWAGHGKPGDLVESPYFGDSNVMVICRTQIDPTGTWIAERFDVVKAHQRIFGYPPALAAHVLIASDSDDTMTRLQAHVRGIGFSVE